jgi:hypothetical protein
VIRLNPFSEKFTETKHSISKHKLIFLISTSLSTFKSFHLLGVNYTYLASTCSEPKIPYRKAKFLLNPTNHCSNYMYPTTLTFKDSAFNPNNEYIVLYNSSNK